MLHYGVFFVLVCAAFQISSAITDGLLPNGDFKYGPKASELKGSQVIGKYALPNWEISGFIEYIKSGDKQGDMHLVVPEGASAVRLGNDASIKQRLHLSKGSNYAITFSAARTCAQDEKLNISVSPESSLVPMQTIYSSNGWDSYAWCFQAKKPKVELVIHNPWAEDDPACGPLIDSVAIEALPPPPFKHNLVKNGDFEEGPYLFANTPWGVLIPPMVEDVHSGVPSWSVESLKAVKYIDSGHYKIPQGKRAVELVAGRESALSQTVRTIPGKTYSLTFLIGDAGDDCIGFMMVDAYAGQKTLQVSYNSNGNGGFKKANLKFLATANRTRVVFLSSNYHMKWDGSLCGPVIDDVWLLSVRNPGRRLL